ncbi:MAG: DUF456 family protein, partial [Opitutales bacterium]|nr:DUF456 family protein [Opitutales bacterium]
MDCGVYEFCAAGAVYLLFFVGAVGSFVPVIPGPFLAGLAPLGYKLVFPEGCVSWELAAAGIFAAAFGQIVDFLASWLGAKKFGATKYGIAGAFVGVIAGIFMHADAENVLGFFQGACTDVDGHVGYLRNPVLLGVGHEVRRLR